MCFLKKRGKKIWVKTLNNNKIAFPAFLSSPLGKKSNEEELHSEEEERGKEREKRVPPPDIYTETERQKKREEEKSIMATQHDRDELFNALYRKKGNRLCFDCNTANPKWTSKNFCVFICLDCSGIHRSLGVHITAVKSANMDRWTADELDLFKASGGNDAARAFFSQHGWNSNERGKR